MSLTLLLQPPDTPYFEFLVDNAEAAYSSTTTTGGVKDSSGYGQPNVVPATSAVRPTLNAADTDGHLSLSFDGVDDRLTTSNATGTMLAFGNSKSGLSLSLVVKIRTAELAGAGEDAGLLHRRRVEQHPHRHRHRPDRGVEAWRPPPRHRGHRQPARPGRRQPVASRRRRQRLRGAAAADLHRRPDRRLADGVHRRRFDVRHQRQRVVVGIERHPRAVVAGGVEGVSAARTARSPPPTSPPCSRG